MDEVNVKVLEVFEHFKSEWNNSVINGLYKIELNGKVYIVFRNGDSWGVLSHFIGEPATKCISPLREDRIRHIEEAIEEHLSYILD